MGLSTAPNPSQVGAAGARYAAAVLGTALCAEASYTTMSEDGAKVDVKFGMRSAFRSATLLTIHCQVKTGQSFRAESSTKENLNLKIGAETLAALRDGTKPALVVWVPPKPSSRVYWHVVQRHSKLKHQVSIPRYCFVTPALRFELSRAHVLAHTQPTFSRMDVSDVNNSAVMSKARSVYRRLKCVPCPVVGTLHVTRLAWRHATRRSKAAGRRRLSLLAVPYLERLLASVPNQSFVSRVITVERGKQLVEQRQLLLWYRNALRTAGDVHSVLFRVLEEVSYPAAWTKFPLNETDIEHRATLVSWWCKKEEK